MESLILMCKLEEWEICSVKLNVYQQLQLSFLPRPFLIAAKVAFLLLLAVVALSLIFVKKKISTVKERASQVAQLVKSLPATQETLVRFLGWEIPLEKG